MKTAAMTLAGLVLAATLTACGGGDSEADIEKDARSAIEKSGLPKSLTNCAIKEIKKDAGSLKEYTELDSSEQQTMAAKAGSTCSKDLSEEDIGDVADSLDEQDVDLSDPTIRKSIITGMTTQGVPTDVANCIVDKMIDEGLKASDMLDASVITRLAQTCQ